MKLISMWNVTEPVPFFTVPLYEACFCESYVLWLWHGPRCTHGEARGNRKKKKPHPLKPMYVLSIFDLFSFIEADGIFVSDINIQRLSALTSPLPSLQQCSPSQPTAYADTTTTFTATNNYPVMDTSASILFHQGQRLNVFSQVILFFLSFIFPYPTLYLYLMWKWSYSS